MPFDQNRYSSLIQRAAFDASFYKGTIQDLSSAQRAMSFVGAPSWAKCNGLPILRQNAAGAGAATTGAVASVINSTQPFWVECLVSTTTTAAYVFFQQNAGGWYCFTDPLNTRFLLITVTAALGNARYLVTVSARLAANRLNHIVAALDPVSLAGYSWINGAPNPTTFANIAPPVVCAATQLQVCGAGGLAARGMIARAWQGTPTNEDATCLAAAAESLVGGW